MLSIKCQKPHTQKQQETGRFDLPQILLVVPVTAGVLMSLPVLAMLARGQQNYIFPVMDMIQSIPRLGANAGEVSLPFENNQILPGGRPVVERHVARAAAFQRVILGEQRDGDVEARPEVDHVCARPGQHGLTHLEAQILGVIWPGSRVQVENEVVPAVVPRGQVLDSESDILDKLGRELVPVQRVHGQDKQTGLRRVPGVKARFLDGGHNLLVGLGDLVPSLGWVDVNPKA